MLRLVWNGRFLDTLYGVECFGPLEVSQGRGSSTVRGRLDTLTVWSLTVHPAANGYLVITLGR